jgi:starch phosphorylase
MPEPAPPATVAYFSMEIGLEPDLPTYSGGLGVLAGDTLRAAADLGVAMVGVSLVHRKGYFRQHVDEHGNQTETAAEWAPESKTEALRPRVTVAIEGRPVQIRAWRYLVRGMTGGTIPVYLLDTDLPENTAWDRTLTDHLYGGDPRYRLCQEVVLGVGGVAMLRDLGHNRVTTYHMNEGHSALLTLGLLAECGWTEGGVSRATHEAVRRRCVFTTHTPVAAGQDQFALDLARQVLGPAADSLRNVNGHAPGILNMTALALSFSRYVNGVAMRHGEISRGMFPGYPINSITNGVHAVTWAAEAFRNLYDHHMPEWRRDNLYLRYAISIPAGEILAAHATCKQVLLAEVERRAGIRLDPHALTFGFARRATPYKRFDLLFTDPDRLRRIAASAGPLQIVFGGKAHPRDDGGKDQIRRVFEAAAKLPGGVTFVYLPEYDMSLARVLCAGSDVWLNTPQRPQEASGTSGMKAAVNGVPSLSILDGWWLEGCIEGVTGWAIGEDDGSPNDAARDAVSLYDKLEYAVAPLYYGRPLAYAGVMRSAIALNASFFTAQRMLLQYQRNAYVSTATADASSRPDAAIPALAPDFTAAAPVPVTLPAKA